MDSARDHSRWGLPRRASLIDLLGLCAAHLVAVPAHAGSYLDRSSLLLGQATSESDYLRGKLSDRELARVIHALASARVRAATSMTVPKEVAQAHPHLLLVLENHERAADAARVGEAQRFL